MQIVFMQESTRSYRHQQLDPYPKSLACQGHRCVEHKEPPEYAQAGRDVRSTGSERSSVLGKSSMAHSDTAAVYLLIPGHSPSFFFTYSTSRGLIGEIGLMSPTIDRPVKNPILTAQGAPLTWLPDLLRKSVILPLIKSICDTLKKLLLSNATICLLIGIFLTSCSSYKQNIMFSVPEGYDVKQQVQTAERNYIIQKNDLLELEVYTNKGERIIDPDLALAKDVSAQNKDVRTVPSYLVDIAGTARFPMIGDIMLEGLSIRQAEEMLQKAYSTFYQDAFVILKFINKRVIVLGAPEGQVIPLTNENVHLVEVLALAKGLNNDAKSHNIRVLRKDQVFVADLSTFEGYIKNNIAIEPGDIVYIEPIRRPLSESLRDYGPILSIVTSLTTLVVVIIGL